MTITIHAHYLDKVATRSNIVYMSNESIKSVGIKKLIDQLSVYLREVKNGSIVLVTDRGDMIAEIRSPSFRTKASKMYSMEEDLINKGILIPPKASHQKAPCSPLTLPPGTSRALLDEERAE